MLISKICPTCYKRFKYKKSSYRVHCSMKCYPKLGKQNPRWKGGFVIRQGYRYIYNPNHPNATKKGYVLEHRLNIEKKIGRFLKKKEVVHHINHNKLDNRISNLMLIASNGKHSSEFHTIRNKFGRFKSHH